MNTFALVSPDTVEAVAATRSNPCIATFGPYKDGTTLCKTCKHFHRFRSSKTWTKCALRTREYIERHRIATAQNVGVSPWELRIVIPKNFFNTGGPTTDHKAKYSACKLYEVES